MDERDKDSAIELTGDQTKALTMMLDWFRLRVSPLFELTGSAGTGKTTLIKIFVDAIELDYGDIYFLTYTGKAALVLRKHGLPGRTIHSAVYQSKEVPLKDSEGNIIKSSTGRKKKRVVFRPRKSLPKNVKLIVIDEASMVPYEMGKRLLRYGIPILAVGDTNQLDPIGEKQFFLTKSVVHLSQIVRQDSASSIVILANAIASNAINVRKLHKGTTRDGTLTVMDINECSPEEMAKYDIIITGRNEDKDSVNRLIREYVYHRTSRLPEVGDRVICRQNNWEISVVDERGDEWYLTNGMLGTVTNVNLERSTDTILSIDFKADGINEVFVDLPISKARFNTSSNEIYGFREDLDLLKFDFGYAITCHLAQGSEYDNVLIWWRPVGERGSDSRRKWKYTAVTRAVKHLTIANERWL